MQAAHTYTSPKIRENIIVSVGIFCFVVLTTISGVVTTYEARDVIYLFRLIAAVLVSLVALFVVVRFYVAKTVVVSLVLYFTAFLYATAAATLSGGLEVSGQSMFIDFLVPLCGIILFGARFHESTRVFSDVFLVSLMFYAVGAFLLTFILGGFSLELPPRFIFEVGSDEIGREENYSLGMTGFFIFASIAASVGFVRSGVNFQGAIYFLLLLMFLLLSALGGGRGEMIVGFLIISFVLLKERKVRIVSIAMLGGGVLMVLMVNWDGLIESIVALQRFQLIFEGDMSSRDLLLANVFGLLSDQPVCLFLGCGPGFFQKYYGYEFGFYPHNSIAEALLIFGFPLLILALAFAVYGAFMYYKKSGGVDLFMVFFVYNFLVSLKSGYLLGSWVLVAGVFFFMGIGVCSLSPRGFTRRQLAAKSSLV